MIGIRFSTRFFIRRPSPIKPPVRAQREIGPILSRFTTPREPILRRMNRHQPNQIQLRQRPARSQPAATDRPEEKNPNQGPRDFVQPEF